LRRNGKFALARKTPLTSVNFILGLIRQGHS
jgi:hypothetical protein